MFLCHAFCGFATCQPFEPGCFDKVSQGIPGLQFLGSEQAQAFDGFVLQHQRLLGMALSHILEGRVLLRLFPALGLQVPGASPGLPIPALGPAADGARGPVLTACRHPLFCPGRSGMIVAAGFIEAPPWPQVAVQAKGSIGLRRFMSQLIPRCCHG